MHEYLDAVFQNKQPSKQEIIAAKKVYRKHYQEEYQESYKENHVQISFRVTKNEYTSLKTEAQKQGLKVTSYVKHSFILGYKKVNTSDLKIKILLSELIDELEASVFQSKEFNLKEIIDKLIGIEEKL